MTQSARRRTVAVMQPYFFPYAGYFRLFHSADHFVIFDCVQFPRRGRVHRCEVPGPDGGKEWLALPLARQPRDVQINALDFAADARACLDDRLARLPWFTAGRGAQAERIRAFLYQPLGSVADYLEQGLRLVADLLGFEVEITRSSALRLDPSLRAQDRVIAAASAVGAGRYVNAPGGRGLYSAEAFAVAGIELAFLTPYQGRFHYMLPALMQQSIDVVRQDIVDSSILTPP